MRMKGKELREFLRVRCVLGVEKVGRVWAKHERGDKEANEIKEKKGARRLREEMDGLCGANMQNGSAGLARE